MWDCCEKKCNIKEKEEKSKKYKWRRKDGEDWMVVHGLREQRDATEKKNSLKSKKKKTKKKIKKKMKAFHIMENVLLPKTAEAKSLCKDQKSKKKKSEKL